MEEWWCCDGTFYGKKIRKMLRVERKVKTFSALRQIEAENVFTFLSTLNRNSTSAGAKEHVADMMSGHYVSTIASHLLCICFAYRIPLRILHLAFATFTSTVALSLSYTAI